MIKKELPTPKELKLLRTDREQTQDDAARSVGYTAWSWNKWESSAGDIPLCVWLVYQQGGIDAVVGPAWSAPAKASKNPSPEFTDPMLSRKPRGWERVTTIYPPDKRHIWSTKKDMILIGKDTDGQDVGFNTVTKELYFAADDKVRKNSPIYHLLTTNDDDLDYLFHAPLKELTDEQKYSRLVLYNEASTAKARGGDHLVQVESVVENILDWAGRQMDDAWLRDW